MAQETERKFLVLGDDYKTDAGKSTRITQGYLSSFPGRTVRVRIKGEKGYLTIKGKSNASGTTRYEWEKEIPAEEASELLKICEPGIIDKIRYEVRSGVHTFEVDEFFGDNLGLVVAEVELTDEDELIIKPLWLGQEVTGDVKYYNAVLSKRPFLSW
ncbi:MAG TPA: CYTH domain-containing protein [Prolixibacteraceae bacterium]|nr:CYTH domain-containing protein [Prolixibacteraceae bacterium]